MPMEMMNHAIKMAKKAFDKGEIPIGAVITHNGEIIAAEHNRVEQNKDCTCHAEINAIKKACTKLGTKLLTGCEMYVTIEPCAMCAGAIINSRIKRLYIGASEPKTGCCGSVTNLTQEKLFNHNIEVYTGFSEDECKNLMKDFFEQKR